MRDIVEKMRDQVPRRFRRFDIFLPADTAIFSTHFGITIQAVLLFALF